SGARLLLAVSGGADSTALLLGIESLAGEFGIDVHAAHLHHGLRGADADEDLAATRRLCERLGVTLHAARWDCRGRMRRRGLSGQAGLRVLRRGFLTATARRIGAAAVATAHTADDQLETVLLRLVRGTGIAGLGGMSARRGVWLKPLLAATRAEIEADLTRAGIAWREDRSNEDLRYARSRVRYEVIPALLAVSGASVAAGARAGDARAGLAQRVARTSSEVRAAARLIARMGDRILPGDRRIQMDEIRLETSRLASYPRPIQRAALRRSWQRLGGRVGLTARHLDALEACVASSRPASAVDLPTGYRAERRRGVLVIRKGAVDRVRSAAMVPAASRVP